MESVRSDWIDEGNPRNPLQKVWQQKFVHQEKECNLRLWLMSAMMAMLPKIIFEESAPCWRQTRHCTSKLRSIHDWKNTYRPKRTLPHLPNYLPTSDLLAYPATCQATKRHATPPQKKTKCTYKAGANVVVGGVVLVTLKLQHHTLPI